MASRLLPYFARGIVVRGYGRGSKELGIPTANYDETTVGKLPADFAAGVYCGWASVSNGHAYKMVMSIGWNPQYQNQQKSMETHIMHKFEDDFYGAELKVCVVHYIRGEKKFDTLNQLILEIQNDISFAESNLSVNDAAYQQFLTYINT